MGPITSEEVTEALKTTKADTSPGPDGRTIQDLKGLQADHLVWAFNSIMYFGQPPQSWTKGRTVLIPKTDKPTQPGQFRPVTISSVLLRTLHKIVARRLQRAAPLPTQQKGFAAEEGVAANLVLVSELIKDAQDHKRPFCCAFIDFRKAFDSVGHPSLVAAATRWSLPSGLVRYIRELYSSAETQIMGTATPIGRGVTMLELILKTALGAGVAGTSYAGWKVSEKIEDHMGQVAAARAEEVVPDKPIPKMPLGKGVHNGSTVVDTKDLLGEEVKSLGGSNYDSVSVLAVSKAYVKRRQPPRGLPPGNDCAF